MSSYTTLASKAFEDGLYYQDINELIANIVALKEFPKRALLGGDPKATYITVNSYAAVVDPVYVEINGTNLGGVTYELHFMGVVTSGDTGKVKLIRRDTLATIVEKTFTNTTLALVKSDAFTLVAGAVEYEALVTPTTGGVGNPMQAYGFAMVQR